MDSHSLVPLFLNLILCPLCQRREGIPSLHPIYPPVAYPSLSLSCPFNLSLNLPPSISLPVLLAPYIPPYSIRSPSLALSQLSILLFSSPPPIYYLRLFPSNSLLPLSSVLRRFWSCHLHISLQLSPSVLFKSMSPFFFPSPLCVLYLSILYPSSS